MTAISITLNGEVLVLISTEGLNIVSVHVSGDTIGPEFSCLDVTGGLYTGDGADKHLIWINNRDLNSGDRLEVGFHESGETSAPGKTIEELYPHEVARSDEPVKPEEVFADLSKRPVVRDGFEFELTSPEGEIVRSRSNIGDYSYGFTVVWNWKNPKMAKGWLTTNSLESISRREFGVDHARFSLNFGQTVSLRVCA